MRVEKQLLLDEIKEKIESSKAIIIANYNRLTAKNSWQLSNELLKSDACFTAVKKRLAKLAFKEKGYSLGEDLKGHIGVFFIKGDPLSAAKTVVNFKKDNEDVLKIIKGHIEGRECSSKDIEALATLPSIDEMRAQILGLLEAPMSDILLIINELLLAPIHCLENKTKKLS